MISFVFDQFLYFLSLGEFCCHWHRDRHLPTTTPSNQSSSLTPIDANINASSSLTVNNVNANSNTFALPLVGTTNNSAATTSATPFLDPIQQKIQQHELLKQLNIMNKELKLLRTQPTNTNTSVPLENVTNLLGIVANVLPSTSTNGEMEDSSKSTKKTASANPSGIRRGRKPYPLDANGNKIRSEKENKETGQKQKKSKKLRFFLLTNINLIVKNNLNI